MEYRLEYTKQAQTDLLSLELRVAKRITGKLHAIHQLPNPLRSAKPLKGIYDGYYRFRIGDYRAIFKVERGGMVIMLIVRIGHRKDIYE